MNKQNKNKGFTLIESIVGVAFLAIISVGVYGAFALSIRMTSQNKARATALTIVNHRAEMLRNLSYNNAGVGGGIPSGSLDATETINKNGIEFTVETSVVYVDDPFDGIAPADTLNIDYKRTKVKVSWAGFFGGEVFLVTDVAPQGVETTNGGGTFSIEVFDADGIAMPNANILLENDNVSPAISMNYTTNENGMIIIPGAPTSTESYRITATKPPVGEIRYSTDRTYGTGEVTNPSKSHSTVTEGGLTEISFAVDEVAEITLRTLTPGTLDSLDDDFDDFAQIAASTNVVASSTLEALILDFEIPNEYYAAGSFQTNTITPASLDEWKQLSWADSEPVGTDIKYQVFYHDGAQWTLIPDVDLSSNSTGFDEAPVDLNGLAATTYDEIRIQGNFQTSSTSTSPYISSLTIVWQTAEPAVIANIPFYMQGTKIIGTDSDENPVYKYSQNLQTGAFGDRDLPNLEWDTYNITVASTTGYDIASIVPAQLVTMFPGDTRSVDLTLVPHASHTLLVTAQTGTGVAIPGAEIRVSNVGLSYDNTIESGVSGQSFFTPLNAVIYNIEIVKDGYITYTDTIEVSGQTNITINLAN